MRNNQLYYVVGVSGSGKTMACRQFSGEVNDGVAIQVSGRFKIYMKHCGIEEVADLDSLSVDKREKLISDFHQTFIQDKRNHSFCFLDGHMQVENAKTGKYVNAMAADSNGITTGIIFLNTLGQLVADNIKIDNCNSERIRANLSLEKIKQLAEKEFLEAENYSLKHKIQFGYLNNLNRLTKSEKLKYADVKFLNQYFLKQSSSLRHLYVGQFDSEISPSKLRKLHYDIGEEMLLPFKEKTHLCQSDYQIISVPRSGNYIANGFASSFNGNLMTGIRLKQFEDELLLSKPVVIVDSVIDSGVTVCNLIDDLSKFCLPIHVVCLSINIKSINRIEKYSNVQFHCLGFSNKEQRPLGKLDMGARLYGTES